MGLVDDRARLTWLVAPRLDQPAIVSHMLDPGKSGGGVEIVFPDAEPVAQRYQPGTLVVETDLRSPLGLVRVIDCLMVPPRGPVSVNNPGIFIRQLLVLEGEVEVGFFVALRYGYGRHTPRWRHDGRAIIGYGPGLTIEMQSELPVRPYGVDLGGSALLHAGQRRAMALHWQDPQRIGTELRRTAEETAAFWTAWSAQVNGDMRAVVLKGMLYHPTGAMLRSATTSVGSTAADGRLAWMDDQHRAVTTFRALGLDPEADYVQAWIDRAGDGGPVRGLSGEEPPSQAQVADVGPTVMVGAPPGDARGNVPYLPDLLDA